MSPKHEGILEQSYWEGVKGEPKASLPVRIARWTASTLRPSIMTRSKSRSLLRTKPLRPTAWLDGMRGFAAFIVYVQHHELWAHDIDSGHKILEHGYGHDGRYHFATLPFVRLFFCGGHYAVVVFFVISGYVLSWKPLSLIHAADHNRLSENLASAMFRRWIRLYIPVVCTTFLLLNLWYTFDIWIAYPERKGSYRDQVWDWYAEFKNFSFVFVSCPGPWFSYDVHTWSLPLEFKGSVITFTTLLALSRLSRNARLWCQACLMVYFLYIADGWYGTAFVGGMMLCDLDLLSTKDELPRFISNLEQYKAGFSYGALTIAFYLAGVPTYNKDLSTLGETPGWYYLSLLKPQAVFDYKFFYLTIAALLNVAAIPRIGWFKRFFETPMCQYLGRISFSFYLVHGGVYWLLGMRIYAMIGRCAPGNVLGLAKWVDLVKLPSTGPFGMEFNFLVAQLVILPLTLWMAEIFTKLVDEPSVKFASWLYENSLAPPQPAKL